MSDMMIVRVDASAQIGIGHVMRCLALAQARQNADRILFISANMASGIQSRLLQQGFNMHVIEEVPGSIEDAKITMELAEEQGADWVVVDGYQFNSLYHKMIKDAGFRLLLVDDHGHANRYGADVVLNQNLSARDDWYRDRSPGTQLLLGTRFALLRDEFLVYQDWGRVIPSVASKVLVTLGGGDSAARSGKVVQALKAMDVQARVVIGSDREYRETIEAECLGSSGSMTVVVNPNDIPSLMAWADMAVAAGGATNWELAFMGLPALVLVIAENQKEIASALDRAGVVENLGDEENVTADQITNALHQLQQNYSKRKSMSQQGRELVDGQGAMRVMEYLDNEHTRVMRNLMAK